MIESASMRKLRPARTLMALPLVIAFAVACSTYSAQVTTTSAPAATGTTGTTAAAETTTTVPVDFIAAGTDFKNLHDMTKVRGLFIDNRLGHLAEAVAVANAPDGGVYPVGTIIQLVPQEAMVKRAPGFDPVFADWEFFMLTVSSQGTEITKRGGAEITNRFGGSCAACHVKADIKFDFVCEKTHGCDPLPVGDEVFKAIQEADPRPRESPH